jgi:DNA polymerase II small subunit/DNA polymerase delta subunit B
MEKEEVIRRFLKNGFQLSKSALPLVLSNTEQIINRLKKLKPRPFIVTEQHIKKILSEAIPSKPKMKVLKEYDTTIKPISVEEYVRALHSYYNKIKTILVKRMDAEKLLSINKITPKTTTFSIIGLVREKGKDSVLLEDPSGEINVYFENSMKHELKEIFLDDVIGVKCKKTKGKCFVKRVFFPDVSLSRRVSKAENSIRISILTNPSKLNEKSYRELLNFLSRTNPSVFLFEKEPNKKLLKDLSRFNLFWFDCASKPTIFQLSDVKILVFPNHCIEKIPEEFNPLSFLISVLRRRRLTFFFNSKSHFFGERSVLDEVPDLIVSNVGESGFKNYKGTTIITNSDPKKIYTVDLKTRDVSEETV